MLGLFLIHLQIELSDFAIAPGAPLCTVCEYIRAHLCVCV